MKRRGFMAGVATLPFLGALSGRVSGPAVAARAATAEPAPAAVRGVEESGDAIVLEYLDHCSSWSEAVERLRDYVADGHPDGDVFTAVANVIESVVDERRAVHGESVLGLYAATALTLARLHQLRLYGLREDHALEVQLVRALVERA